MAISIIIYTDEIIGDNNYSIISNCLVSNSVKKSYSFKTENFMTEELISYYSSFPHTVEVLYSRFDAHRKRYESQLNFDVFVKQFNWGELKVNLRKIDEDIRKILVENESEFFLIDSESGSNFWFIQENKTLNQLRRIKFEYLEESGYTAEVVEVVELVEGPEEHRIKTSEQYKKPVEDRSIYGIEGDIKYRVRGKLIAIEEKPYIEPWQKSEVEQFNSNVDDYFTFWEDVLLFEKFHAIQASLLWGFDKTGNIDVISDNNIDIKGNWSEDDKPDIDSIILLKRELSGGIKDPLQRLRDSAEFISLKDIKKISDITQFRSWIEESYSDFLSKIYLKETKGGTFADDARWNGDFVSVNCKNKRDICKDTDYSLLLNLSGTIKQIERKEDAINSFKSSNIPIVHLNNLFTGKESIPLFRKVTHPVFSNSTFASLFYDSQSGELKNIPYDIQKRATEISLETNDIAVIQGPPGTGKTTVAKTISKRLCEIYGECSDFNILLTSYQHVAVDNISERVILDGFPVMRELKKKEKDDGKIIPATVDKWRNDKVKSIRDKRKELGSSSIPTLETINVINDFFLNTEDYYPELIDDDDSLSYKAESLKEYLKGLFYLMTKDGFETSLIEELGDLKKSITLIFCEDYIYDEIEGLAESYYDKNDEKLFAELCQLLSSNIENNNGNNLDKLLENYYKSRKEKRLSVFRDTITILKKIRKAGEIIRFKRMNKKDILANYLNELENEDGVLMDGLNKWCRVYASTLQKIEDLGKEYDVDFHTVIVDEAGRSNPLDLLIAMVQSHKKIILLGDQNQLPPFVEQKLEEAVNGEDNQNSLWLKDSFFGKLYEEILPENNKIMLDRQYRSHPDIGNVISNIFYDGKLNSPLEREDFLKFDHYPDPITWIDIKENKDNRAFKSWSREAEVHKVVSLVKQIREEKKNVTIGIITPYNNQKDEIEKRLKSYRNIKIGTIDSFQGREFDVVILSLVRTLHDSGSTYGNLESKNRLCVAISRQKSLLLIVGDSSLAESNRKRLDYIKSIYRNCKRVRG